MYICTLCNCRRVPGIQTAMATLIEHHLYIPTHNMYFNTYPPDSGYDNTRCIVCIFSHTLSITPLTKQALPYVQLVHVALCAYYSHSLSITPLTKQALPYVQLVHVALCAYSLIPSPLHHSLSKHYHTYS